MVTPQDDQTMRDYYSVVEAANIFSQRTNPRDLIQEIVDSLAGVQRDEHGELVRDADGNVIRGHQWLNDDGIRAVKSILLSHITSFTSLSRYPNEDRVNVQLKDNVLRKLIIWVTKNKKRYDIEDKNIVLSAIEKPIVEQMYRAVGGFEAELTAKAYQVLEQVDHSEMDRPFWKRKKPPEASHYG